MVPHSSSPNSHFQWQKVSGLQGAASYDGIAVTVYVALGPDLVSLGNRNFVKQVGMVGIVDDCRLKLQPYLKVPT